MYDPYDDNYKYISVINGEIYFDEFKTIDEIKLPEVKTFGKKDEKDSAPTNVFSPEIEDASP